MKDKVFIDTNVFIYLYSEDEPEKKDISQKNVNKYDCVISTQVINEFCNVCISKLGQSSDEIEIALDEITSQCTVLPIDKTIIKQALEIHKKYKYKYFDSLIISSALSSNCKYLLTEDMSDGQLINDKLTIVNVYSEKNISLL